MIRSTIVGIFLLTFLGCANHKEDSHSAKSTQEQVEEWALQIKADGKEMDIKDFNKFIQNAMSARHSWAFSPIGIAQQLVGMDMQSPVKTVFAISRSGAELITSVWVVIIEENILDDSIADQAFLVQLELGGSIWRVSAAFSAHKCREGRGENTGFHSKTCQ